MVNTNSFEGHLSEHEPEFSNQMVPVLIDLVDTPREIASLQFNSKRAYGEFTELSYKLPAGLELAAIEIAISDIGQRAIAGLEEVGSGFAADVEDYHGTLTSLDEYIQNAADTNHRDAFIAALLLECAYIDGLSDPEDKVEELGKNLEALMIEGNKLGIQSVQRDFLIEKVSAILARAILNESFIKKAGHKLVNEPNR